MLNSSRTSHPSEKALRGWHSSGRCLAEDYSWGLSRGGLPVASPFRPNRRKVRRLTLSMVILTDLNRRQGHLTLVRHCGTQASPGYPIVVRSPVLSQLQVFNDEVSSLLSNGSAADTLQW